MKLTIVSCCIVTLIALGSCGGKPSNSQNSDTTVNVDAQRQSNPKWPYPDWTADPSKASEKAEPIVFQAGKLTEIDLSIPADWSTLAKRQSQLILRSPSGAGSEKNFANMMVHLDSMKPVNGVPIADQKRHFDYSAYEPEAAYKDYLQKKQADPSFGRTQEIAIDGVWGILEQSVYPENDASNSEQKGPVAVWLWTTFMKLKSDNNKFEIFVGYPVAEMDKYKTVIAGMTNTVKIKRSAGLVLLEKKPQ